MQAKGSGQQKLEQTVEAADVDILVGQDAVERFLRQRKVLTRQQDDRMQDAIGQRAGNAVVLSDGDGSAQRWQASQRSKKGWITGSDIRNSVCARR